jgi:cellulose synthase/poly-beta-1,6-N-acetylglucosamine synthase-like glycosyltransferase
MNKSTLIRDKFNSRKFAGMLWAWLILFCAYDLSMLTPAIQALYSTLVGGIIGIYAIYCGVNVSESIWGKKDETKTTLEVAPTEPDGEPK